MKQLSAQITRPGVFQTMPMDMDKANAYHVNQIVELTVKGTRKARSILQMNTYWACCNTAAKQTDHKQWNTKEKVDFQCRVGLHFVNPDLIVVKPDGSILFSYRSIAVKNLNHIEACNYFDRALDLMAAFLGITVDKLIAQAKSEMKPY